MIYLYSNQYIKNPVAIAGENDDIPACIQIIYYIKNPVAIAGEYLYSNYYFRDPVATSGEKDSYLYLDLYIQDPVAIAGEKDGIPVFKLKSWRKKGEAIPEVI